MFVKLLRVYVRHKLFSLWLFFFWKGNVLNQDLAAFGRQAESSPVSNAKRTVVRFSSCILDPLQSSAVPFLYLNLECEWRPRSAADPRHILYQQRPAAVLTGIILWPRPSHSQTQWSCPVLQFMSLLQTVSSFEMELCLSHFILSAFLRCIIGAQ